MGNGHLRENKRIPQIIHLTILNSQVRSLENGMQRQLILGKAALQQFNPYQKILEPSPIKQHGKT